MAAFFLTLGQAQSAAAQAQGPINDPLEGLNRKLFVIHRAVDRAVIRPLMVAYVQTPRPIRSGLVNVVGNLGEPITFVNDVLQARPHAAGRTLTRFATNSTIGLAGLWNPAEHAGFPRHVSDFGQTLGRYGVGPGPFLIIPGMGPSSVRDITGRVVDGFIDPVNRLDYDGDTVVRITRPAVTALEARDFYDTEIRELDRTALDPYVTLRSAYLQNRLAAVRGPDKDIDALPSFSPDEAPPTEAPKAETPVGQ